MDDRSEKVHITTNDARGAETHNVVRWVLGISLLAAIILLSAVWMTGAATNGPTVDESTKTAEPTQLPRQ